MENQRLEFTRHSKTDIFIGTELFSIIGAKFNLAGLPKSSVVITNETLSKLWLEPLTQALNEQNIKVNSIII